MAIKRLYDTLVGATVRVNQLVENGNFESTGGWNIPNSYTTTASDGVLSITVNNTNYHLSIIKTGLFVTPLHKCAMFVSVKPSKTIDVFFRINDNTTLFSRSATANSWNLLSGIAIAPDANTSAFQLFIARDQLVAGDVIEVKNIMLIDLTAEFGSTIADYLYSLETATAGAGIAKLREWGFLTGEYIPYNPGSLESVEATAHKMVGFNQWDEEWELGTFSTTTGLPASAAYQIRSKNYTPIFPGTTYFARISTSGLFAWFYDSEKNFIYPNANITNTTFVTPDNARYMRIATYASSIQTTQYRGDICVNLSSSRNGEYEPYHEYTYDLGTDTLRGLFKLDAENNLYADGDTKASDGTVTRKYQEIDLGTLDWVYANSEFSTTNAPSGIKLNMGYAPSGICSKYVITNWQADGDKILFFANNGRVYVHDSAYTDAATFKSAMSGVMLVYEASTPTTEQSTPFTNPQICDPDGTEEYVTSNGVPVGHETRYQL